jgi:hypothetical protein
MPVCALRPKDKRAFIGEVGEDLVRKHGKRKYYAPADIRRSTEACGYPVDIHCWAYCIFASPQDFKALHDAAGEACDYAAMKSEVLTDLSQSGLYAWRDIDLSWLEWPDIDVSSLFEWFDFSP